MKRRFRKLGSCLFAALALQLAQSPVAQGAGPAATSPSKPPAKKAPAAAPVKKPAPATPKQSPQNSAAANKGVVLQYSEAQKLFNAGKFNEALIAFDHILKKYPSHEPTIIQYAKTLYRLDRIPESYNLFARINPQYLDPETSYEYGYSSYVNQRWDAALFAFKRVPLDHALYDLANYYGALSAIKLKKYAEAEDMLDKAVVLPDKLAKSRQLYQKHVQSLKHLQEKADLETAATAEKTRIKQQQAAANSPAATPGQPAVKSDPNVYVHKGFLEVLKKARLKVAKEHQTIDMHGYSQTTYDNDVGEFSFRHGYLYPLSTSRPQDGNHALGLQLYLGVEDRSVKGKQERIVVYEDSRDIPRVVGNDIPASHLTTGKISAETWAEFALGHSWWAGMTAGLGFDYPKFERGQRTSRRFGTPHVGKKYTFGPHAGSVLGTFTYEQLTDSETEPLIDISTTELSNVTEFASGTITTAILTAVQYKYQLPTIYGPDDVYYGTLKVRQLFPLGFYIEGKGVGGIVRNNIVGGIPSFGVASADGSLLSGSAKLVAEPVTWFSVRAEYTVSSTTWTVHQAEREEAYKKNVPDYVDETVFAAALHFNF